MTYLRPHNRPFQTRARFAAAAGIVLVVVVALVQFLAPHFFPALATSIAAPFWRTEFAWQSGSLASPEQLLRQNEDLKLRLAEADVKLQSVRALELENIGLKAFFGRTDTGDDSPDSASSTDPASMLRYLEPDASSNSQRFAAVLMRPPHAPYDELIVDLGESAGISVGDRVYAPGSVLIGRVSTVFSDTSKVMLYSSPEETYEVLIGEGNIPATAAGRGGGQYSAEISREADVSEGDPVIAPSIHSAPFGTVTSIVQNPTQPFMTILFAPPINVYSLRWVLVDTDGN